MEPFFLSFVISILKGQKLKNVISSKNVCKNPDIANMSKKLKLMFELIVYQSTFGAGKHCG
jgi:hypothetical protein